MINQSVSTTSKDISDSVEVSLLSPARGRNWMGFSRRNKNKVTFFPRPILKRSRKILRVHIHEDYDLVPIKPKKKIFKSKRSNNETYRPVKIFIDTDPLEEGTRSGLDTKVDHMSREIKAAQEKIQNQIDLTLNSSNIMHHQTTEGNITTATKTPSSSIKLVTSSGVMYFDGMPDFEENMDDDDSVYNIMAEEMESTKKSTTKKRSLEFIEVPKNFDPISSGFLKPLNRTELTKSGLIFFDGLSFEDDLDDNVGEEKNLRKYQSLQ